MTTITLDMHEQDLLVSVAQRFGPVQRGGPVQRCGSVLSHINSLSEDGEWHCQLPDGHDGVCRAPDGTTW